MKWYGTQVTIGKEAPTSYFVALLQQCSGETGQNKENRGQDKPATRPRLERSAFRVQARSTDATETYLMPRLNKQSKLNIILQSYLQACRSRWPRGLRRDRGFEFR
jgi:hypothetical protein